MLDLLAEQAALHGIQAIGAAPAVDEVRAFHPWAESVVCIAVSYLPPDPGPQPDGVRGLVARFARSADYHAVVREKLALLAELITTLNGSYRQEIHVDTGPLPERMLAILSGIGWLGRNCCVYVDGCGSYVAVGEIVTAARIPASETRQPSRCGDCTLCVDACPTGALHRDGKLDRSRCLSHISQSGQTIPDELRAAFGNRLYGCDVCQQVCPNNTGVTPANAEFAQPQFPGAYPDLLPLLNMAKYEFDRTVKPSSIGWIGRLRLRRNSAVAAGNSANADAIPELREMLSDPNEVIRSHAEWALQRLA